ncbi:MAG: aminotransferase class I/II-fold pyridoxal phosphate-dependent enzyme [Planctomycetia bacterium]|nr:aminotransferase class I/II-fold pyridoxal phosphate-dependent enzyme [Planctomycetia bacterium]
MPVSFSEFADGVGNETAFTVLAAARRLKAAGKRVIELEIGDSPYASTQSAKRAGIAAIEADQSHYGPSLGLAELREAAARYVRREYGVAATAANVVIGPGAKIFEQLFCEAFLDPGDGVLVFSPHFPTYLPNIARRGAHAWLAELRAGDRFRPRLDEVERFLRDVPRAKAVFLNSPHNPTGGVATEGDLRGLADLVRGRDVAVFSDEPYDRMVWQGCHRTILSEPGMLAQCVAAYTFSKSYSMSGWRLGFAVSSPAITERLGTLINTTLSCVSPMAQLAGAAALEHDAAERDRNMERFGEQVSVLSRGLASIPEVRCQVPDGTFYVFPDVRAACNRLGLTSHGLAMFLLEGADDHLGVACLGGECFGAAGAGFLRFSCAEPPDEILEAAGFFQTAITRTERARAFVEKHPEFQLQEPYALDGRG